MNSLRMSFWIVPESFSCATPCSSAATMKPASTGSTAPFIVIDTLILSSGMPSNRIFMSSTRVDRDAGLADIADDARMIAVVAAMGGEIERDRQAHLPGRQVLAVEGVGTPRRSRSRHIAGPSTAGRHTSWRARRAGTAESPACAPERFEVLEIGFGVKRLDVDALGRRPIELIDRRAAEFFLGELAPLLQRFFRKLGHPAIVAPRRSRALGCAPVGRKHRWLRLERGRPAAPCATRRPPRWNARH